MILNIKPVLVIMAAGMGSRYGGLKQIDPLNEEGDLIIDFSLYDAYCAGFEKAIFIIRKELEKDFRERIGDKVSRYMQVEYVYQDITDIPEGCVVPDGRTKPWGTGHAILCCLHHIDSPFAVINADDYYGRHAFASIYQYLMENPDQEIYHYAMVGYRVENTLTDFGYVSRGVCQTNNHGDLVEIIERTHIEKRGSGAAYTEDDGATWEMIKPGSIVSMNMWGFNASVLRELQTRFQRFLIEQVPLNPLKSEYYLPMVVDELLNEQKAVVHVLPCEDKWYGVTYKEDKPVVANAVAAMKETEVYPLRLWK